MQKIFSFIESKKGGTISLIVIYLVFVLFSIFFIIPSAYGPVHYGDESRYWNMALSISKGTFTLSDFHHHPLLYPFLLVPAFYNYPIGTYTATKILNSLYFTSALFPAFLLLRKYLDRKSSLIGGTLLLLNPAQFVYPRQNLSEVIFYPILLWAFYFSSSNRLESKHNTKIHLLYSFFLGISISLLVLTRYIGFALIPVFLIIWWLHENINTTSPLQISWKKLVYFLSVLLPIILTFIIWIGFGVKEGVPISDLFGFNIADD